MSLLNKNLQLNDRVKIVIEDDTPKAKILNFKRGTIVGFETKVGSFGVDHFYIVLLDSKPIGTPWLAHTLKECHIEKL